MGLSVMYLLQVTMHRAIQGEKLTEQGHGAGGYPAFWNAAQQNVASVALARRLVFRTEQPIAVVAWSAIR